MNATNTMVKALFNLIFLPPNNKTYGTSIMPDKPIGYAAKL